MTRHAGHDHHRQPPGNEPMTARSPLWLRAVLAGLALLTGTVAGVVFGVLSAGRRDAGAGTGAWAAAAIGVVVAVTAAVDLWVVWHRSRL